MNKRTKYNERKKKAKPRWRAKRVSTITTEKTSGKQNRTNGRQAGL
jgi:hypothetical protein